MKDAITALILGLIAIGIVFLLITFFLWLD